MEKNLRYTFLLIAFLGVQNFAFGQFTSEYPPEPTSAEHPTTGACGEGDGGSSGGISPPVGLCLPINDYIFPLLISGITLGAFSLFYLQKQQEFRNAIE